MNDKKYNRMSRLGISTDLVLCYLCADKCAQSFKWMSFVVSRITALLWLL